MKEQSRQYFLIKKPIQANWRSCENGLCMRDHCRMGRRNANKVCAYARARAHSHTESNYTSSLLVTAVLEMLALIGVAGKCEVCFPPPLSPPPPPPPL